MKRSLFFGFVLLILSFLQAEAQNVTLRTGLSGRTFAILGAGKIQTAKGDSAFAIRYQTTFDFTKLENLRAEVRALWIDMAPDLEKTGLTVAIVSATIKPKEATGRSPDGYNFGFSKDAQGQWTSEDHELARWLQLLQNKDVQARIAGLKGWASRGDVLAMDALGRMYLYDRDPAVKNYKEAFKCFMTASQLGDPVADDYLGEIYINGLGVAKDAHEAVKWFTLSANLGNAVGEAALGQAYFKGDGVTLDATQAFHWVNKAAEQGLILAEGALGTFYLTGQGVKKDLDKAFDIFQKAAGEGDVMSESNLAYMYFVGAGTPKNCDEGFKWAQLAAQRGSPEGEDNLGSYYEEGCGTAKDLKEALKWFGLSKEHGCSAGKEDCDRLQASAVK